MDKLSIPPSDAVFVEALRELIRTGVTAAPTLEHSPLLDMEIVTRGSGSSATSTVRAHTFIAILRRIIRQRLEGKEAETATILFGFEEYAGTPVRERYRAVAKLYNPYWTWENYRKEPLTRHLFAVYLALKREIVFVTRQPTTNLLPQKSLKATRTSELPRHADKVLIIQNITREGSGLFQTLLDEVAVAYEVVDLSKGEPFPDPTNYVAVIVLGGPDSVNDKTEKIIAELGRIRQALDAGVPYLGVCLGLQLAVKATGGNVVESVKEIGLSSPDGTPYSVTLTELALTALGKKDPLFVGLKNDFRVFQLHSETVELTPNMQLLAVGQHCRNQIVKIRRGAYGIQSHFELTREMLTEWLNADPDLSPLDARKVMAEFDAIEEVYTITGLSLLRNFLHIAGIIS